MSNAAQNQISIGLTSPLNSLAIQNSPVTGSGEIGVDLVPQQALVPGSYSNPLLTVNQQGVITEVSSGATPPISALTLTSSQGTLTLSNASMTANPGGTASSTIDLQTLAGVQGVYGNPSSLTVDQFGRVTAVTGGVPSGGGGTVTSVGLTSPSGTVNTSVYPVTEAGNLTVDLPLIPGIPFNTVSVPCPSVGVDAYGRVTVLSTEPSVQYSSPEGSLVVKQIVSGENLAVTMDVGPSGVSQNTGPVTIGIPTAITVGEDGRVTSLSGTPSNSTGIVTNITSSAATVALTPAGGTLGSDQVSVNVDLPVQGGVVKPPATVNSVTVNEYGIVMQGTVQPYIEQVNLSSTSQTIAFSNTAITNLPPANSTSIDLAVAFNPIQPISGSKVTAGENVAIPGNIQVNKYGQVTSVQNLGSSAGTLTISGSSLADSNIDLTPVSTTGSTCTIMPSDTLQVDQYGRVTKYTAGTVFPGIQILYAQGGVSISYQSAVEYSTGINNTNFPYKNLSISATPDSATGGNQSYPVSANVYTSSSPQNDGYICFTVQSSEVFPFCNEAYVIITGTYNPS